jgi:predicted RNase H-like nuclease (RuvC/YqgF family)
MANVFGILTAIVFALAAFVAYKNKSAYETEISATAALRDKLAKSQARLKAAKETTADVVEKRTREAKEEIVKLAEETEAEKKTTESLKSAIATMTTKLNASKVELEDLRNKAANIDALKGKASKLREASTQVEEITQTIAAAEAKLANLTAQSSQAERQLTALRGKVEAASSGQSLPTLKTRIRSIYPTWGFVTLAAGQSGGVVANSTLDVVRGGETVARLLVTAVERNSASASIIPDSVEPDVTLRAGDRVVASRKVAKPAGN